MYQIQTTSMGVIMIVKFIDGGIVVTELHLDRDERDEWQPIVDSVRTGKETIHSSGIRNFGMGVPVS